MLAIADDGKASVIFGRWRAAACRAWNAHGDVPGGIRHLYGGRRSDHVDDNAAVGHRGVSNRRPLRALPIPRPATRASRPLTVLAMGRIVSLLDAEDFARAFAGIGKTHAASVWHAGTRWVLT